MYNLPEITESINQLESLVRQERDAQIQHRLRMLLLLKTGEAKSRSAAARQLGVHRNTVANWLEFYEEGGLDQIQEIGEPGPDPGQQSIPPELFERLKERLSEPEGFGSYRGDQHRTAVNLTTLQGRRELGLRRKRLQGSGKCLFLTDARRHKPFSGRGQVSGTEQTQD